MHTMQGIARLNAAHDRATARTRHALTTTTRLDTLRAHTSVLGARVWGFATLEMIDLAYGQAVAEQIRAAHDATPSDLAALRSFWASILPRGDAR